MILFLQIKSLLSYDRHTGSNSALDKKKLLILKK